MRHYCRATLKVIKLSIALILSASAAHAEQMTFIADRERDGIAFDVSTLDTVWPAISGRDLTPHLEADGKVDVARLYDRTFDRPDAALAPIEVLLNGVVEGYAFGRLTDQCVATAEDGGALTITGQKGNQSSWFFLLLLAGVAALADFAGVFFIFRRPSEVPRL